MNQSHPMKWFPKKTYYIISNSISALDIININWLEFSGVNKKIITTNSNKQKILSDVENYPKLSNMLEDEEFEIVGFDTKKVDYQTWKDNFEDLHEKVYIESGPNFFNSMHNKIERNIKNFYKNDYFKIREIKEQQNKQIEDAKSKLLPIFQNDFENLPVELQKSTKQFKNLFTPIDTIY